MTNFFKLAYPVFLAAFILQFADGYGAVLNERAPAAPRSMPQAPTNKGFDESNMNSRVQGGQMPLQSQQEVAQNIPYEQQFGAPIAYDKPQPYESFVPQQGAFVQNGQPRAMQNQQSNLAQPGAVLEKPVEIPQADQIQSTQFVQNDQQNQMPTNENVREQNVEEPIKKDTQRQEIPASEPLAENNQGNWQSAVNQQDAGNQIIGNAPQQPIKMQKYEFDHRSPQREENNGSQSAENNQPNYELQSNNQPNYELQSNNQPNYEVQNNNQPNYELQTSNQPNYEVQTSNQPNYKVQSNNQPNLEVQTSNQPNYEVQSNNQPNYELQTSNQPNLEVQSNNQPNLEVQTSNQVIEPKTANTVEQQVGEKNFSEPTAQGNEQAVPQNVEQNISGVVSQGNEQPVPQNAEQNISEQSIPQNVKQNNSEQSIPQNVEQNQNAEQNFSEQLVPQNAEQNNSEQPVPQNVEQNNSEQSIPQNVEQNNSAQSIPQNVEQNFSEQPVLQNAEQNYSELVGQQNDQTVSQNQENNFYEQAAQGNNQVNQQQTVNEQMQPPKYEFDRFAPQNQEYNYNEPVQQNGPTYETEQALPQNVEQNYSQNSAQNNRNLNHQQNASQTIEAPKFVPEQVASPNQGGNYSDAQNNTLNKVEQMPVEKNQTLQNVPHGKHLIKNATTDNNSEKAVNVQFPYQVPEHSLQEQRPNAEFDEQSGDMTQEPLESDGQQPREDNIENISTVSDSSSNDVSVECGISCLKEKFKTLFKDIYSVFEKMVEMIDQNKASVEIQKPHMIHHMKKKIIGNQESFEFENPIDMEGSFSRVKRHCMGRPVDAFGNYDKSECGHEELEKNEDGNFLERKDKGEEANKSKSSIFTTQVIIVLSVGLVAFVGSVFAIAGYIASRRKKHFQIDELDELSEFA